MVSRWTTCYLGPVCHVVPYKGHNSPGEKCSQNHPGTQWFVCPCGGREQILWSDEPVGVFQLYRNHNSQPPWEDLYPEGRLDQLYSLQRVKFAQPVKMCCVDLVKILTVSLGVSCWGVIHKSVVCGPLLRAIWSLYNWSRNLVFIAGSKSDQFPMHAGLWQRCPLSLIPFIIFMDRISRCRESSLGCTELHPWFLQMKSCWFHQTMTFSMFWGGLQLSEKQLGRELAPPNWRPWLLTRKGCCFPLQVCGEVLCLVEEFKYLGVLFKSKGKMNHEIDKQIGAASAVMWLVYWTIRAKKKLGLKAKLSIFYNVHSMLIYGHELWVVTKRTRLWIQAAKISFPMHWWLEAPKVDPGHAREIMSLSWPGSTLEYCWSITSASVIWSWISGRRWDKRRWESWLKDQNDNYWVLQNG